MAIIIDRFVL